MKGIEKCPHPVRYLNMHQFYEKGVPLPLQFTRVQKCIWLDSWYLEMGDQGTQTRETRWRLCPSNPLYCEWNWELNSCQPSLRIKDQPRSVLSNVTSIPWMKTWNIRSEFELGNSTQISLFGLKYRQDSLQVRKWMSEGMNWKGRKLSNTKNAIPSWPTGSNYINWQMPPHWMFFWKESL